MCCILTLLVILNKKDFVSIVITKIVYIMVFFKVTTKI